MLRKDHSGIASFPVILRVQNSRMWLKFTRQEKFPRGLLKVRLRICSHLVEQSGFHENTKLAILTSEALVHENKKISNKMLPKERIELETPGALV